MGRMTREEAICVDDCISRQAAITAIQKEYCDTDFGKDKKAIWENIGLTKALHIIQDLSSAEHKGKWVHDPDPDAGLGWYTCSECGHNDYEDPDFCPNCGADMRGEEDE